MNVNDQTIIKVPLRLPFDAVCEKKTFFKCVTYF